MFRATMKQCRTIAQIVVAVGVCLDTQNIAVLGNQVSGGWRNCEAIKWDQEEKANALRAARMEGALTKFTAAQQNCVNLYDNDMWACRRDYDVAAFEADAKFQAAILKCFMTPEFWKYSGCVGAAKTDYEAQMSVANYKKWDCYDRAYRKLDGCVANALGVWYSDRSYADSEREARQIAIDMDYEACVAQRGG